MQKTEFTHQNESFAIDLLIYVSPISVATLLSSLFTCKSLITPKSGGCERICLFMSLAASTSTNFTTCSFAHHKSAGEITTVGSHQMEWLSQCLSQLA